jgi:hypothetical protein
LGVLSFFFSPSPPPDALVRLSAVL